MVKGIHGRKAVVAPAGVSPKAVTFMGRAEALLRQARTAPAADRIEYSYQAALRVAGAVLEEAPGRRRRADSSAWARLRRHAPAYSPWAERFEAVSPLREDLLLGLKRHPDELEARRIQAMAGDFLAEVSADFGLLDDVACPCVRVVIRWFPACDSVAHRGGGVNAGHQGFAERALRV